MCLEDPRLLDALGAEDRRSLVTLSFGNEGTAVTLCLHLAVHGVGDVGRGIDALDLDTHDLGTPDVGGFVENLAELGVDGLT